VNFAKFIVCRRFCFDFVNRSSVAVVITVLRQTAQPIGIGDKCRIRFLVTRRVRVILRSSGAAFERRGAGQNQAETAIYSVKKTLDELGDKVTNDERSKVEAAISDLENADKSGSAEEIKKKLDDLYKAMEPISKRVYQEAGAQQQQGGCGCDGAQQQQQSQESDAKKADGDFVDADYKIVDDQ